MIKKTGTLIGLILGLFSIFGAFLLEGGSFKALFLFSSLVIVFGGTFSAIIIGFGLDKFKNITKLIRLAYFPREFDVGKVIDTFVELSIKARKEGLLSIEKNLNKFGYVFPKKMTKFSCLCYNNSQKLTYVK